MLVIRPTEPRDLDAFYQFAANANAGLTNLPMDKEILAAKIASSQASFAKAVESPDEEFYSFALENLETGETIGTCGIFATTGHPTPQYRYRIELHDRKSKTMECRWTERVLVPVEHRNGPSEICSLYLLPDHRRGGVGRLLSFSRFLFMHLQPQRFTKNVIAEMRGVSSDCEECPFWNAVGRHFTSLPFCQALHIFVHQQRFIREFLPEHPIYISLLPKEAQRVIGRTHPQTQPALKLLEKQGFRFTREVDVFDAGPTIESAISEIAVVKQAQRTQIKAIVDALETDDKFLLSNTKNSFRATVASLDFDGEATISADCAEALQVGVGDEVLFTNPWTTASKGDR